MKETDSSTSTAVPRILVSGGSGFIGTNAVEHWRAKGCRVLSLDIRAPANPAHGEVWVQCDILDRERLISVFRDFRPNDVLHLAARTDLKGRSLGEYRANTDGVTNIIDAVAACPDVRRVIFASSRMVCRIGYQPLDEEDYSPPNFYGQSKVIGERLVRKANPVCQWVIVRPTSIWGPWFDLPYKQFFLTIARGIYVHPAGHNPRKSFGFVFNSVKQVEALLDAPADLVNHQTTYLCDYPPLRLREWAELIRKHLDAPKIHRVPYTLLRAAAWGGDALEGLGLDRVPVTSFMLSNLVTDMFYDTGLLERICGPLRYSVEDGVRATVDWMTAHGELPNGSRQSNVAVP